MIQLNPKQSRRVKALVRRECCNYDNGNCILLDSVCAQTITYSHIICKWFKKAVLPIDKELYIQLMKPKNASKCVICGKDFTKRSNRAKYCDNCRKVVWNKQKAAYIRNRRRNSRKLDG